MPSSPRLIPRAAPYAQEVPAVRRAVRVLDFLASAPEPLSLSGIGRALDISPSSLLAILTTLRRLGLVTRFEPGRLYAVAPGLACLGTAAERQLKHLGMEAAAAPTDWPLAGPIEPAELDAFLEQDLVATLSYLSEEGYPTTVPLWYVWDRAAFWLVARPGSEWARHVRRDPRVSLAISESAPPLRRVLARGRLEPVDNLAGPRWAGLRARLAARYAGLAADPRGGLFRLTPDHMIAWRGLLAHSNRPVDPARAGRAGKRSTA
jgi:DNA-binding transcriptional ArsR family regulator